MNNKIGIGSTSLLLLALGVFITSVPISQISLGDVLIESIGLSAWSGYVNGNGVGFHYGIYNTKKVL